MDNVVINALTSLLVFAPFIMLVSKLSLLLPATATDVEDVNFSDTWNLSYGNSWRLALLVGLLPVVTNHLLEYLAFDGLLNMLTYYGAWLIVGAVEVGLLSLCYAYLTTNLAEEAVSIESTSSEEISL